MKHLWEVDYPYYATEGCYYVSHTLGSRNGGSYDGNTCHTNYASWQDFKDGKEMPYTAEQLKARREYGINDAQIEADAKRWYAAGMASASWLNADKDYNLLYRWDWKVPNPDDYTEDEEMPGEHLSLFYMLQRKAKPMSICIYGITKDDEPEVREFLRGHWQHIRGLWAPVSETP